MTSLSREKRKIQLRTIAENYKILKEIEEGESWSAVSSEHSMRGAKSDEIGKTFVPDTIIYL